jgi:hypothetical protein
MCLKIGRPVPQKEGLVFLSRTIFFFCEAIGTAVTPGVFVAPQFCMRVPALIQRPSKNTIQAL